MEISCRLELKSSRRDIIVQEVGAVVLGENELTIWSPSAMDANNCRPSHIRGETDPGKEYRLKTYWTP